MRVRQSAKIRPIARGTAQISHRCQKQIGLLLLRRQFHQFGEKSRIVGDAAADFGVKRRTRGGFLLGEIGIYLGTA